MKTPYEWSQEIQHEIHMGSNKQELPRFITAIQREAAAEARREARREAIVACAEICEDYNRRCETVGLGGVAISWRQVADQLRALLSPAPTTPADMAIEALAKAKGEEGK